MQISKSPIISGYVQINGISMTLRTWLQAKDINKYFAEKLKVPTII
jgi:hypothetical protein